MKIDELFHESETCLAQKHEPIYVILETNKTRQQKKLDPNN